MAVGCPYYSLPITICIHLQYKSIPKHYYRISRWVCQSAHEFANVCLYTKSFRLQSPSVR